MNKTDKKFEPLLTPWKIGNVEIKNRIVMCPMGGTSLFGWFELGGCHFDKEAAKLFIERANNNVGLIIPGIAPLRDTFWGKWLWQNPKMFEELKEFMDEIHKTGAKLCAADRRYGPLLGDHRARSAAPQEQGHPCDPEADPGYIPRACKPEPAAVPLGTRYHLPRDDRRADP